MGALWADHARIIADNRAAAAIPTGTVVDTIFGSTTLGRKRGQIEGWDLYEVYHSGRVYSWSSASVLASFGAVNL